jgi:hypothetical protein
MANSNQYFSQGQGLAEQDKVAGITKILLIQVFTRYENASESQVEVGRRGLLGSQKVLVQCSLLFRPQRN